MEVGVGGADLSDAVFQHQRRSVEIVHRIASQARMTRCKFAKDIRMPLGLRKDPEPATRAQDLDPGPRLCEWQGSLEYAAMGAHPQELVNDSPRQEPEVTTLPVSFNLVSSSRMLR